ncbi:unnamed protein product [Echinostoma caproni]|uniref:5'-nucleotidase n=1 Tax=Echinostoma caproni TaxID=27848 RepID=A0A183AE02_9TREM|nr:unnamed protein product [Echinostoma caproni]
MALWLRLPILFKYQGCPARGVYRRAYCGVVMKFRSADSNHVLTSNLPANTNDIFNVRSPDTLISNEVELVTQLGRMIADGYDKLQVISDFDHTISMYRDGEIRMLTTHEAIEKHPDIEQSTIDKLRDLRAHFLPLETNYTLSPVVRRANLERWWNMSHELLLSEPITRKMITEIESVAPIALRKDFVKFTNYLQEVQVPLTIFSAGLGDVIQQMLHNASIKLDSINVVANFIEFDKNNKTLSTVLELGAFQSMRSTSLTRPNVILLGDSAHDIDMIKGHQFNSVLKIGYLNQPVSAILMVCTYIYIYIYIYI